jgi:hypothetical protein
MFAVHILQIENSMIRMKKVDIVYVQDIHINHNEDYEQNLEMMEINIHWNNVVFYIN